MQQRSLAQGRSARGAAHQPRRRVQPFTSARCPPCAAASNGNGNVAVAKTPSPAQTIRTIVDISHEGTLCSVSASGQPVGVPVGVNVDKQGHVKVHIGAAAMQVANLHASANCSLTIQPTAAPARSVAAVTLVGSVDASAAAANGGELPMSLHKCIYFGGLDQAQQGQEVAVDDYLAAEPDVLRKAAPELVHNFNNERAEDLYRIVSDFLKTPLTDMEYVELLWIDYLGMYVRADVAGKESSVLRVPFYRPVLDERDARSVITMAAQLAWERERNYTPPLPSIFADAAGAASNN